MAESNYDILGVKHDASDREIREAFRKLILDHHSDRGGDEEVVKKIIQAYEDLKIGKTYPDTEDEKLKKSRVYSGDSDDEQRKRNPDTIRRCCTRNANRRGMGSITKSL